MGRALFSLTTAALCVPQVREWISSLDLNAMIGDRLMEQLNARAVRDPSFEKAFIRKVPCSDPHPSRSLEKAFIRKGTMPVPQARRI
jgi:hypothetical protein